MVLFVIDNVIPLKICSYNCRGYNNSKSAYITQLLSQIDVLCFYVMILNYRFLSVLTLTMLSVVCLVLIILKFCAVYLTGVVL